MTYQEEKDRVLENIADRAHEFGKQGFNWEQAGKQAEEEQHKGTMINDLMQIVVGVCKEDNPRDVDEAYGVGTYARIFPSDDEVVGACMDDLEAEVEEIEEELDDYRNRGIRSSEGGHRWTEFD